MNGSESYHFPPELFSLLKDAIPKLVRSKKDVLQVFRGAGVSGREYRELKRVVHQNPDSIYKWQITERLLEDLNERGDAALTERRRLLKRIVEWDDFSTCWPERRAEAKGIVSDIRDLVGKKDSFTRMRKAQEEERRKNARAYKKRAQKKRARREKKERVRNTLFSLFSEEDPQSRGKRLEKSLTQIFEFYDVSICDSFTRSSSKGGGVIEQIDGAVEIYGNVYLVEAKWHKSKIGVPEVSHHLQRVFRRADARALIVSASGFTAPAIETCRDALSQKVVVLCELEEVVQSFVEDTSFLDVLRKKIREAELQKEPFVRVA